MHRANNEKYEYGMDAEIQRKLASKYSPQRAQEVMNWIGAVIGENGLGRSDIHVALKDGVRLCKLVNKIKAGSVRSINNGNAPFVQRENIAAFCDAIKRLGVKQQDVFVTQDLFEGDNLVQVIDTLYALAGVSQGIAGFHGPYIGVKPSEENKRNFTEAELAAGKGVMSKQTLGSYGIAQENHSVSAIDKIIRNADEFGAHRAAPAANARPAPAPAAVNRAAAVPNRPAPVAQAASPVVAAGPKFCASCGGKRDPPTAKFCGGCGGAF